MQLTAAEYDSLQAAQAQRQEVPMADCPVCIHNSDARARAEADLAVAQAELTQLKQQVEMEVEADAAAQAEVPPAVHPAGLCNCRDCEPCATAAQENILQGRQSLLADFDAALAWANRSDIAGILSDIVVEWERARQSAAATAKV